MIDGLTEQVIPGIPAKDAVVTICIDQLTEILVGLDQCLHIFCRIAVMHIIIGQTVTKEQRTM